MEFSTKRGIPEKRAAPCIVVGVYAGHKLSAAAETLDRASKGSVREVVRRGDMEGKLGSTLLLYRVPGVAAERVLLVGLGDEAALHEREYREAARAAVKAAQETGASSATLCFTEIRVGRRDSAWKALQVALVAAECAYRFEYMKSKKSDPRPLANIELLAAARDAAAVARGLRQGAATGAGMSLAKDLGNLPGNVCTPTYLAEQARKIAREWKLGVEVLGRKDMEKLGMGSLLSVAQGSRQPPKLIVLNYAGGPKKAKPVVLVGKGITFDTGGISIKPADGMERMKDDMAGGAAVACAMRAIGLLKAPIRVIGVVPTTENMPGGRAIKPGDVLTSASGKTVEVINTDAEGRLVLGDGLWYARQLGATHLVDIATLTGACIVALGKITSGIFGAPMPWVEQVRRVADRAGDRVWPLPLFDEYRDQLKSDIADIMNTGGRPASSITAAMFIKEFAGGLPWAHLDIAGTAWADEARPYLPKGPSGVGVRTLAELAFTSGDWT